MRRPEELGPFSRSKVFLHRDRLELLAKGELPPPVTVEIDLADGFCNHSCPHCFFGTPNKSNPKFFPDGRAATLGVELASLGVRAIEFPGGGEPTTHPRFSKIICAFHASGLPLGLVTNGQLMRRVLPVASKFEWVRISLDAGTPEVFAASHGVDRFMHVVDGIHKLANLRQTQVGVAFLVTPGNWHTAAAAAHLFLDAPISYLQYRPAAKVYWNANRELAARARDALMKLALAFPDINIDISEHKWDRLNSGRTFPTCETSPLVAIIKADGTVPFCCLRRDDESITFGNAITSDFASIWFNDYRRNSWTNTDHSPCPLPCKHDSYNEAFFALRRDAMNSSFL